MKIKKIIIVTALIGSLNSNANDEISYSWVEVNYSKNGGNFFPQDVFTEEIFTLDGSFEITDNLYISADVSKLNRLGLTYGVYDAFRYTDNSYGLALGFHNSISEKTDLYYELGYRKLETAISRNLDGAEFTFGSRTVLSPKFELITAIGYQDIKEIEPESLDINNFKGGFNFGVSGLYKINNSSNIHLGFIKKDTETSPMIGYRFNW